MTTASKECLRSTNNSCAGCPDLMQSAESIRNGLKKKPTNTIGIIKLGVSCPEGQLMDLADLKQEVSEQRQQEKTLVSMKISAAENGTSKVYTAKQVMEMGIAYVLPNGHRANVLGGGHLIISPTGLESTPKL